MFSKDNILKIAKKADYNEEFLKELGEYLDFVHKNPDVLEEIKDYYALLFESEKEFFPINDLQDVPLSQKSEEKFKGFFSLVVFLAATQHFENYIKENGFDTCKYDLIDTYYKNIRRFSEMNYVRDNTYALLRHGYFVYGYAKPFIMHIGRLSYELRQYNNALYDIYEKENGERVFVPNGEQPPKNAVKLIENGEAYITIHIPGVGKLTEESFLDSIETATPILKKVFARYNPKLFMCTSWLISPQISSFLKETSNIKKFQSIFDTALGNVDNNAIYENIFKVPLCPIEELKPANSFQQSILDIYKNGDFLHTGIGVLKKELNKL